MLAGLDAPGAVYPLDPWMMNEVKNLVAIMQNIRYFLIFIWQSEMRDWIELEMIGETAWTERIGYDSRSGVERATV
jgi:hypothetical protein